MLRRRPFDDEKQIQQTIAEKYGVVALTHYTSLESLIKILKDGELKAGGILCSKTVMDCHDAIYFTVLFDFHLESQHKPSQYLLVFSPKLLEKVNKYFLNSGIRYGEKGDKSFDPIKFKEFRENQMKEFDQLAIKSPYGQNEAVFLLNSIDLDQYLLEIRVLPQTKHNNNKYNFTLDQLKKHQVPQKYIDRVVNVKDFIVKRPTFNEINTDQ